MAPTAKKAATKTAGKVDYWKGIYVVAVLVAGLFGALKGALPGLEMYMMMALPVIAFLYGMFYFKSSNFMNFGLRFLVINAAAVYGSTLNLAGAGSYVAGFFTGWAAFQGVEALGMGARFFYDNYLAG